MSNKVLKVLCCVVFTAAIIVSVSIAKNIQKKPEPTSPVSKTETTTEEPATVLLSYVYDKEYHTKEFRPKQIMGRIESEDLNINCNLVYGSGDESLRVGAGLHKCSSLPGMKTPITDSATCPIIAGHCRTVFEGMSAIDPAKGELPEGITVTLVMPYGNYTYEIVAAEISKAADFRFSDHRASYNNFEPDTLILYTCYPFGVTDFTKSDRLFLTGKLMKGDELVDDTLTDD